MALTLMSPAFAEGEAIPRKYAREGENLSPPLKWTGAPEGTRSFALIVEDPDAPRGTFRHWMAYNIPPDRSGLAESIDTGPEAAVRYAANDFGNSRYDGPEPPRGDEPHHYHFRLAALDLPSLAMPGQAGAEAIWHEVSKHALAQAELVGTYAR